MENELIIENIYSMSESARRKLNREGMVAVFIRADKKTHCQDNS